MESKCINYSEIDFLTKIMQDYLNQSPQSKSFYSAEPSLEGFKKALENRSFSVAKRKVLADALTKQYEGVQDKVAQTQLISLLQKETTFTVATGHQLALATGPLYFIYKILSVVKLARTLKEAYPENDFVPVYWMATEDHDFLEINHFNTKQKHYEWSGENNLAVGWKKPEVSELLNELASNLPKSEHTRQLLEKLEHAYSANSLADATRHLVHDLLGKYGVLIIDGDDPALKGVFADYMLREINEQRAEQHVTETIHQLNQVGYKEQVTPRDINLFYLGKELRERITKTPAGFATSETNNTWTLAELEEELKSNPERFSPNVLLRPLYQEVILPNLSYSGGAGEMSYWFELKAMFEAFEVDFPILLMRNSAVLVSKRDEERMQKLKLNWSDLFRSTAELEKQLVAIHGNKNIDLAPFQKKVEEMYVELAELAKKVDNTLVPSAAVSETRSHKALERLQKKLIKGEKLNIEVKLEMLYRVLETFFPGGTFQERKLNIAEFYAEIGDALFDELLERFEPLQPDITVIKY